MRGRAPPPGDATDPLVIPLVEIPLATPVRGSARNPPVELVFRGATLGLTELAGALRQSLDWPPQVADPDLPKAKYPKPAASKP